MCLVRQVWPVMPVGDGSVVVILSLEPRLSRCPPGPGCWELPQLLQTEKGFGYERRQG